MARLNVRPITEAELIEILDLEWKPAELLGDAIPEFLRGIPDDTLNSVYASGTSGLGKRIQYETPIPSGELIAGIDVYRNSPEDSVELNKDWYFVIRNRAQDTEILVAGPIKDNEHWLNEIPQRLKKVTILGVPPK